MEVNGYSHLEQSYLINELTQGMELARQLAQMGPEHSVDTKEMILQQIVSSYDKALSILGCVAPAEPPHQLVPVQSPALPSSPSSIVGSPNCNGLNPESNTNQEGKGCSLKRYVTSLVSNSSNWTKQVKVNPEIGLDGPPDDGHSWRKYGQKDILGAKYPRSYYRCTYRNVKDCWATRQVQRSENDITVFDITYKGKHTCNMVRRAKSAPTSPGNQEPKKEHLISAEYQQDFAMVSSFQSALPPNNAEMHNMDSFPSMTLGCLKSESPTFSTSNLNNLYGDFSTPLVSPSTSGSSHFTVPTIQHQHHNIGADFADMILAATSSSNSPMIDPDFSLDPWSFNPSFSFNNNPGFF